jgi:hypothetical protein
VIRRQAVVDAETVGLKTDEKPMQAGAGSGIVCPSGVVSWQADEDPDALDATLGPYVQASLGSGIVSPSGVVS